MLMAEQLNHNADWCLSGGADGADLMWGKTAKARGHGVIHFSFARHRVDAPAEEVVRLNPELLTAADAYCLQANKFLNRKYPPKSTFVQNLLRRDYYQIESAQRVYAVSTFKDGQVDGGTAWAVTMFLMKHNFAPCDAFVFDQDASFWSRWNGDGWSRIYEPPKPFGIYAGIGKRKINPVGKLAIAVLMDYDLRSSRLIKSSSG
jgi:hypothetical protein